MKLVALALVLVACGGSKDERTQSEHSALRARLSNGSFEIDGVGTWKLPAEPTPEDFAPALDAMAAHGQPRDGVLVWGADGGPAQRPLARALAQRQWGTVYCMRDGSNCPAR